ncbi:STAS domain-containing protein [Ruminococcus difficilis]|uniref:STAS domain-containing protein n=1 Tax=Ruminococcus difficilis TaxID=2763069 RepID=A0A934WU14_9FIRM|nr:STAS domain-containing protein [Ruminococcus difficilis]MBK6089860.1 STAS domain-containing protein [Ruminococcus difficilis]
MDQNLLERVNPVFNTAKMTVFQLAAAGVGDAASVAEKLNLSFEETQNSATTTVAPEQMTANMILVETRWRTCAAIAEETGCKTLVDLPCGYTPRAKAMAQKGIAYYGLDLPAAIAEAEPAILSLIDEDQRSLVHFCGVDATNGESLKAALKDAEGPLCITTEGLLMYFTDSEVGALCDNIRMILKERGGCWLTADTEAGMQYILTMQPIAGDRFMEIMMQSKTTAEDKSDVNVGGNSLNVSPRGDAAENMKNAMKFLAAHGLRAERMILSEYMPEINSLGKVTPDQAEAIRQNMHKCAYWKITTMDKSVAVDSADLSSESFDVQANVANETLNLSLKGRVDTLTAPNLLALYERIKVEHTLRAVAIDCGELAYISSAGLRVLLIMKKGSPDGVRLTGINATVREILAQTGFDSILDIAD